MMRIPRTLGSLALALTVLISVPLEARAQADAQVQSQERPVIRRRIPEGARSGALPFIRTELFFGTAKPNGVVTEEEFQRFVDVEVTPRFPDGLTLLKADGQFRGEDNNIIKERSFVLILLYPYESFGKSNQKIQRLREIYLQRFEQESVLRVDDRHPRLATDAPCHLEAVHVGHRQVREDEVGMPIVKDVQRGLAVGGHADVEALRSAPDAAPVVSAAHRRR